MNFMKFHQDMNSQLKDKLLFDKAKKYACEYLDNIRNMDVYPSFNALSLLDTFNEPMPKDFCSPHDIIEQLHRVGSPNTVAQSSGRYFGFVVGGVTPVALATKWLADVWDQNTALFVLSPIAAKLEEVCEKWLVELFGLPYDTAAGFVSGSSTAIICGLAAARNELLLRQDWDVAEKGLFRAPPIRVVIGRQAHSSIWKALSMLGMGKENAEIVETDEQGRMRLDMLPPLDGNTLLILQAGNVNGGAFDPIDEICDIANKTNAWIHIDGAFGLWASACENTCYLTKGIEKADSWSVDAHKTLNAPYDCGIILCKKRSALVNTMQSTGSYIQYSENRDGMLYTPEMSRRARGIELWATLKYFGKSGINELINHLCDMTKYFAAELQKNGFIIINEVIFNQISMRLKTKSETEKLLEQIQTCGKCWCGGAMWNNEPVIRLSICSWQTTINDIDECVNLFVKLTEPGRQICMS